MSGPGPERSGFNLRLRLLLATGFVLICGMAGTSWWMIHTIERIVTTNAGAVTALYVDATLTPAIQDPAIYKAEASEARAELNQLLNQGALGLEVLAFKLWDPEGQVTFSTRSGLEGRINPENPRFQTAMGGRVYAELRQVPPQAIGGTGEAPTPVLEVYSPIRSASTGQVIGVAEFYSRAAPLLAELHLVRLRSWLLVAAATLVMGALIYGVVARGDRIIAGQRQALREKISALSETVSENARLSDSVRQANARLAGLNERMLRRLSADIHDGPAQLLAYAALRHGQPGDENQVQAALEEALTELRQLCQGMALPELHRWSPASIAGRLAEAQQARSGQKIETDCSSDLPALDLEAKNCLYRFVQEGLANAARHAAGAQVQLSLKREGTGLLAEIRDHGPGFAASQPGPGLGLSGLRERVAALQGRFILQTAPGQGTLLSLWLNGSTEQSEIRPDEPPSDH